ncbi:nucleoside hydrolase, partial [Cupriavidus campinensis]|uniref:nucleoside hydrolase n=1 Tax=Cupriavidus campinensis TaxID=151783 RepID=UPI00360CFEBF
MTASVLPVILDGDPGLDDAVAWLLALASPEVQVLALCAVHGNVGLPLTTRNSGVILALAGRTDVPVHVGADRPLLRAPLSAAAVHGESGLPATGLPDPVMPPAPEHA